ncbi:MAG: hypothetical protein A3B86_01320 [Candidatus Yanofskybacteria bacterium RIFCSPHIGHO2_02_FULL_38_22b]|uniref:Uncharacterized protein n=1 Tax=Candidatus Yanofskybacteria bacterium RIFCSPHIGHO2_02_FULL_38_22b TaxID=1802673 RepID=A0A1F8F2M4_9BACT|nr:MAG: hypothetical protein A3B86_01320 [Candidatus Yanofskybacteria bacterium RIFCSPHIGHO2_02_FULL_38_22b]OGN20427.1 MAG: hypothetical protein A2910_01665 [Candidatus Yanofskybacteria bacterium RIFCSPLOWO2_01_FULL_39_28]
MLAKVGSIEVTYVLMEIKFYPDSDLEDFRESVLEYQKIWDENSSQIISSWESHSGLKFRESYINAIVWDGISASHPLSLRYDLLPDGKKDTLAHELGHRLLYKRLSFASQHFTIGYYYSWLLVLEGA